MSNQEDFQTCLPGIQAVPNNEVKEPNMPVDKFVQEADSLYTWLQSDIAVLTAKGLTEAQLQ